MRIFLLALTFFFASLSTFIVMPASAQSAPAKPNYKLDSASNKNPIKSQKNPDLSLEQSEAGEAAQFLNEIENDLLKLKLFKLADTDKNIINPQIANSVIRSGKDFKRFQKIVERILYFHKMTELCSGVLFEDKNPMVFTYRLRTISFSTGIFDILSNDETAALIAHEAGHIYFGKVLMLAREANDDKTARIVELKSDAIALYTLKKLKINPTALIKALKKLIKAREKLGLQISAEQSPSLEDRIKLTEYFLKKFK